VTTNEHTNKQVTTYQNTRERKCGQHNNKLRNKHFEELACTTIIGAEFYRHNFERGV